MTRHFVLTSISLLSLLFVACGTGLVSSGDVEYGLVLNDSEVVLDGEFSFSVNVTAKNIVSGIIPLTFLSRNMEITDVDLAGSENVSVSVDQNDKLLIVRFENSDPKTALTNVILATIKAKAIDAGRTKISFDDDNVEAWSSKNKDMVKDQTFDALSFQIAEKPL